MSETTATGNLLDFNWDDNNSFFGENNNTPEATSIEEAQPKPEESDEEDKESSKSEGSENEDTDDDNFFEEVDKQNQNSNTNNNEESGSISNFNDYFKDLKEAGILKHVNVEEGEEIDTDRLFELQEEDYELEMSARLQKWASQDLDEDAQAFIKFKTQGGSTEEFFRVYGKGSGFELGDLENEDYQDELIRYNLRNEDWDTEEIEERLEALTTSGKKAKIAEKYHNKLETQKAQEREKLVESAAKQRELAKQQEEQFKDTVKTALESSTEVNGIKITPKDKTDILNFLTKKNYKINDERSITGFQRGLSEVFKDTNKVILLAKLLQNDFDFSSIEKSAVTKKTKEVKRNIEHRQSGRPFGSGSSSTGAGLASLFDK